MIHNNNEFIKALKSFNTYLTQNAHLRHEIDNLRVDRNRFEELHKKLEKQYQSLRQQIAEVIENSTSAYDQRYLPLKLHNMFPIY